VGYTSSGLAGLGVSAHYEVMYDTSLSQADGLDRASALLTKCEEDFALIQRWFGGIDLIFGYPIPVLIAHASGGATWSDPPGWEVDLGSPSPAITISPGSGTSVDFIRYLLVSEVAEMFMASQDSGWFEPTSFFSC